jgi:hypothetical protein
MVIGNIGHVTLAGPGKYAQVSGASFQMDRLRFPCLATVGQTTLQVEAHHVRIEKLRGNSPERECGTVAVDHPGDSLSQRNVSEEQDACT